MPFLMNFLVLTLLLLLKARYLSRPTAILSRFAICHDYGCVNLRDKINISPRGACYFLMTYWVTSEERIL